MEHFPLMTTLAAGFAVAWLFAMVTNRLGLSPIVGYLLAGVAIGPYTPGFVGDTHLAAQLAEVGVILLMFGVGLHFHFKDLLAVWKIAVPGAIGQTLATTVLGTVAFAAMGWSVTVGLVISVAMAVASTVVLMRVLVGAQQLDTPAGHAAVGWLIVEDIITVLVLVLIPVLAQGQDGGGWLHALGVAIGKLAILLVLMVVAGSRLVPFLLVQAARLRSRELFTLTVLVLSIAVATGAAIFFGASVALGAFLAGMLVAQSAASEQAAADLLPMRDAFAVLFFVSVGMLFDPRFLIQHPLLTLAALLIVLVVKPLAALVIVRLCGYPLRTGLTVALGLAQVGEFSFILSDLARTHHLITDEPHHLLVASAIISITLNPLLFSWLPRIERRINAHPRLSAWLRTAPERLAQVDGQQPPASSTQGLTLLIGYGPVGRQLDRLLQAAGRETLVIDLNVDAITELTRQGRRAVYGDAGQAEVLRQAGVEGATELILTMSDSSQNHALIALARNLNPALRIVVRTRYLRDRQQLDHLGVESLVIDEAESAVVLAELVLQRTGVPRADIESQLARVRAELGL